MPQYPMIAYQLGCKYASRQFEKTAAPVAPGMLQKLLASRGAQYAAGGLGGAALGAAAGGEDNRLRGAMMGAGLGLGAVGGARAGHKLMSGKTPEEMSKLLQKGNPESLYKVDRAAFAERHPLLAQKNTQGLMGLGGGAAAGMGLGLGAGAVAAPAHQDQSWTNKIRGMLPF